jgi:hypothetical protein
VSPGDVTTTYDWKTVEEGVATSVFVATSPLLAQHGAAASALDPAAAARLWDVSVELINQ